MRKNLQSIKIWQSYGDESVAPFFGPSCSIDFRGQTHYDTTPTSAAVMPLAPARPRHAARLCPLF